MAQERFVTDNPFRVLSLSSETGFGALRRRADGAARAASAGIVESAPFDDSFGTPELAELSSSVRALDRDPERRTIFRILWPLTEAAIPPFVAGGNLNRDDFPPEEIAQFEFLREWYVFLRDRNGTDAAMALANWGMLRKVEAFATRLRDLLAQEDELSPEQASDLVYRAEETLERHMLELLASDAARRWEAGESAKGSELTRVILDSSLDEHLKALALEPLAELGQRLDARLQQMQEELPAWRSDLTIETPREATRLRWLGQCLANRVPLAAGWKDAEKEWNAGVCHHMLRKVMQLHEAHQNQEALQIAEWTFGYAKDPELKARIERDIEQLRQFIHHERFGNELAKILPIKNPPPLYTLNGCGARLYGNTPFAPDPTRYFTILYLTFLFIPILPLRRYLVHGSKDGYYFHGKTRWTPLMLGHFALASGLLIWWFGFHSGTDVAAPTTPQTSGSSYYSSPSAYPSPDPATSDDGSYSYTGSKSPDSSYLPADTEEDQRRKRLEDEGNRLAHEIKDLNAEVTQGAKALEKREDELASRKKSLEARRDKIASANEEDAFNADVRRWNRDLKDIRATESSLKAKAKLHDKRLDRYKEIEKALG